MSLEIIISWLKSINKWGSSGCEAPLREQFKKLRHFDLKPANLSVHYYVYATPHENFGYDTMLIKLNLHFS